MPAHVHASNELNKPTPVAIVIGADPTIPLTAVSGLPRGVDELGVADALRGKSLERARCETIDLEVPTTAEIVIEGEIPPNYEELEGPFGKYHGYMGPIRYRPLWTLRQLPAGTTPSIMPTSVRYLPVKAVSCVPLGGNQESIPI